MAPAARVTPAAIQSLLAGRMDLRVEDALAGQLARYLELLLRWNGRTNLSAIREPEAIVLRHFGESLQCAAALPLGVGTLLDYGSGAGFPGAICALARPEIHATLAESQGKKAAFLQELCRCVPVAAEVHAGRVEALAAGRCFDVVTLRAVDRMDEACREGLERVKPGGQLVAMTTVEALNAMALAGGTWRGPVPLRGSEQGVILSAMRVG